MNAGSLHTGEFYAWKRNPPKGRIPIDATKVQLRHIMQRKQTYMQNRQTFAAVTVVDSGREIDVPAREIIMFWDEYEGEQAEMLREKREREIAGRRHSARREVTETLINDRLSRRDIPVRASSTYGSSMMFPTEGLKDWLSITEADVQRAVDKLIEKEFPNGEEEDS